MIKRVKIVTFVPKENADEIRNVLGSCEAGKIGEYSFCSFSVLGKGRFTPSKSANPHVGKINRQNVVVEERVEVVCAFDKAKKVITEMKRVHPYEEVAFDIYPLLEEKDL